MRRASARFLRLETTAKLAEQIDLQVRFQRQWSTSSIPLIFMLGLLASSLGLYASIAPLDDPLPWTMQAFVFGFFVVYFGLIVVMCLLGPYPLRPRIVPYFGRPLGPVAGPGMLAFRRGGVLFRQIDELDQLAQVHSIRALSSFGYADDYYQQPITWYPATEGLHTVNGLRDVLDRGRVAAPGLRDDLDALARALDAAANAQVGFSLVLRLHAKDSLQAVCSRENRAGAFW